MSSYFKNKSLKQLYFSIFILLLPIQLGKHFWPEWSLVQGVRLDYLSPTIYLTDILTVPFVFLLLKDLVTKRTRWTGMSVGLIILLFINSALAVNPQVVLMTGVKLLQVASVIYFIKVKKLDFKKDFVVPILISSIFVSLIAIFQFTSKSALGGVFYFLGERNFNIQTPGIALVNIAGVDYLRAYSVFSHPNSLAGFLGVVLIAGAGYLKHRDQLIRIGLAIILLALVLTFSKSAILALVTVTIIGFTKFPKCVNRCAVAFAFILSLLMFVSLNYMHTTGIEFLDKRILLNTACLKLFLTSPLYGVGVNNFVLHVSSYTKNVGYWFVQPVHNAYLSILTETGVVGFLLMADYLLSVGNSIRNNKVFILIFIFILITSLTDHYWITLQQNILLLGVLLGFFTKTDNIKYDS